MKTLIVIERNKGILHRQTVADFTSALNVVADRFNLAPTFFGLAWIEHKNFIIYTNYSNWQFYID